MGRHLIPRNVICAEPAQQGLCLDSEMLNLHTGKRGLSWTTIPIKNRRWNVEIKAISVQITDNAFFSTKPNQGQE